MKAGNSPLIDKTLKTKKIFFFDLDGTIYLGDRLLPGARKTLSILEEKGIAFYFLSNNSSRSKQDYVEKLSGLGIKTTTERILLSTDGVIAYLKNRKTTNLYIVGTRSMIKMFAEAGFETASPNPRYVILGYDTELDYEKIKRAALLLQEGAELLATHPDFVCPTPKGPVPDVGSFLAMFKSATGISPVKIFGKPHTAMVEHILRSHGVSADEVVMVGDRLYTDKKLADNLGCDFICVLSGETKRRDIEKLKDPPALTVENVGHLAEIIE
ncbi:MAG: HAD-IIA family hydrolase [Candidatus Aminicenantes bacterium]|nr:HAD-IIA family hydrolase [Candidatus Aminicenantes bacterium]